MSAWLDKILGKQAADETTANADIGIEVEPEPDIYERTPSVAQPAYVNDDQGTENGHVDREMVLDAMHDVIDPELGYNIVDIGLIYEVHFLAGNAVQVVMTMTTPGCPAQDYIMNGVTERGMQIYGVEDIEVELVWHPAWNAQDMMTPVAKAHFGITD